IYTDEVIETARPVTVNIINEDFNEALKEIFKGQPLTYSLENNVLIVTKQAVSYAERKAPPMDIRGRVTDEKGEPMPGVTVRIKGTNQGTSTDNNGNFTIRVPDGSTILTFSFI